MIGPGESCLSDMAGREEYLHVIYRLISCDHSPGHYINMLDKFNFWETISSNDNV